MKPIRITLIFFLLITVARSVLYPLEYPHELKPDPLRFAGEIAAFQAADVASPPPKGAILCTGSSSMRMWHPRIQKDLPGLTLIPRGFGGSHYTDVIHYRETLIFQYAPRALLLYEGDNDAAYGKSPERIVHDFKFLVQRCREKFPELRIYVIGAKPSIARWNLAKEMQAANALIKAYCYAEPNCTYIDVWPALLGDYGEPRPELLIKDKLHLNTAGYNAWARAIAPVLIQGELRFE